jgi:aspartate carbamoyltransferase catalytic subunit
MASLENSLISIETISDQKIENIFQKALSFSSHRSSWKSHQPDTAALLFFESSTRTRCSFELACAKLGVGSSLISGKAGTSLEKGETSLDTVLNIAAMGPDLLVIRSGDDLDLLELANLVDQPIINAGWGVKGHPTQGLLDVFTLNNALKDLTHKKILIVGDIVHSRVAASTSHLLTRFGAKVNFCGPDFFIPKELSEQRISSLKEGLAWADAVIALRCQFERHSGEYNVESFKREFQLNRHTLSEFKGFIMHPGPVNHGVEVDLDLKQDSRSLVFKQVENGVFVRMAIIDEILNQVRG